MARTLTMLRRYRHFYLLVALVVLIFVKPLIDWDQQPGELDIFDAMFFVAMVAAVYTSAERRHQFRLFLILAATSLATRVVWRLTGETDEMTVIYVVLASVAWGYAITVVLRSVFGAKTRVTADTIYAAVSGYLLVGMLWTFFYVGLWVLEPGSFEFGGRVVVGREGAEEALLGFSFTTLTTLGYGNISPKTMQADSLATLEAIFGQMYVAILVARLVGIQVAQATAREVVHDLERDRK